MLTCDLLTSFVRFRYVIDFSDSLVVSSLLGFPFWMHRLSKGAIMRTKLFMLFCIKNYIGTQGEDLLTIKVLCGISLLIWILFAGYKKNGKKINLQQTWIHLFIVLWLPKCIEKESKRLSEGKSSDVLKAPYFNFSKNCKLHSKICVFDLIH